eukprot:1892125-Pleurochrysis_carterae.AAC.1
MASQCNEFSIVGDGAQLLFYKTLVCYSHAASVCACPRPLANVLTRASSGSNAVESSDAPALKVGQWVRERAITGHCFVVTRMYKPLLGAQC